jgi:hypothetical protein
MSPFSSTGFSGVSVSLSFVANGLFLIALIATCITAAILYYHWIRYGVGIVGTVTIMIVYAVGMTILLLAALGFLTQI